MVATLVLAFGIAGAAPENVAVKPMAIRAFRLPQLNAATMQASPILKGLDEESALFQRANIQAITSRGALANGYATRKITFEDGRQESLGTITREFLLDQNVLAKQARTLAGGVLARPVEVRDDVLEFDDAYVVMQVTSITVADPAAFSRASPEFRTYLGKAEVPANLTRANLRAESLPGFETFLRDELPQLPAGDPLRRAFETGGETALLRAIADGQGTHEVMDTLFVPKVFPSGRAGVMQRPAIENGVVRYDRFQPTAGILKSFQDGSAESPDTDIATAPIRPPAPVPLPSVTTSGTGNFETQFMAGFTRGRTWEWERRWRYPSGFFRLTLRGHYGVGLRIPIEVKGSVSPTEITVKDSQDQLVPVRANVTVRTLDADPGFYAGVGLRDDPFKGKEAVCEAGFGWGMKFRALWMDIIHVPNHEIAGFSLSQNFKPPFGKDRNAFYRLEIPPSLTGTSFNYGAVSGFAQAGLRFDGKGTVTLDAQPFCGDRQLPVQHLRFTSEDARPIDFLLPALAMNNRQPKLSAPFGLDIRKPAYSVDLSVVPEMKAEVTVGYDWVSHTFNTGWKSLNAFRVDLGKVSLSRHAGTRDSFRYDGGRKQVEYLEGAAAAAPRQYRAHLISAQSNRYVRAGVGPQQFLAASSERPAAWETFEIHELGQNLVAIRSVQNHKFVRIGPRDGNAERVAAVSDRADVLETFRVVDAGNGRVAFQAIRTNKFLRAGLDESSFLAAVSDHVSNWEKFVIRRIGTRP